MYADQSRPGESGNSTYLNREHWAQYYNGAGMNHAVCIVGWDDNYSVDNFNADLRPANPGAWLVKNSWGSQTDAGPDSLGNVVNRGAWGEKNEAGEHTGYFWISYEDTSLIKAETYEFAIELDWEDDYECLQYDYMPAQHGFYELDFGNPSNVVSTANVFEVSGDKEIKAVSAFAPVTNTRITLALYRLNDNAQNPTDGQLPYRTSKNFEYAGYHRFDVQLPTTVRAGQRIAVVSTASVVTPSGARQYKAGVAFSYSKLGVENANQGRPEAQRLTTYSKSIVHEGESFAYFDGAWQDWTVERAKAAAENPRFEIDNFGLKVYTVPAEVQDVSVAYHSHVQTYGWEGEWAHNGDQSGTTGQAKRLEAFELKLENAPFNGSIEYRLHVQGIGWEPTWAADGAASGTTG